MALFALKEWQVVNDAILKKKQFILIRKGGILDTQYDFPPDKKWFFLFPTREHQKKEYVKNEFHYLFSSVNLSDRELESEYRINVLCKLIKCVMVSRKEQLEILLPYVIYTMEFLNMRFNYRPKEPLCILFIAPEKLRNEISVIYDDYSRGCKSWIELNNKNMKIESPDLSSEALFGPELLERIDKIVNELGVR